MKKYLLLLVLLFSSVFTASAEIPTHAEFAGNIKGEFPDGMVGKNYHDYQSVSSGFENSTWQVVNGTLPPGLELDKYGWFGSKAELKGTPSKSGSYTFTVLVTYSDKSSLVKEFDITILDNPDIKEPVIVGYFENGEVNKPYSNSVFASKGHEPYKWQSNGELPPGLKLKGINSSTLTLSGTPQKAGTYEFELKVTDKFSEGVKNFTVVIN